MINSDKMMNWVLPIIGIAASVLCMGSLMATAILALDFQTFFFGAYIVLSATMLIASIASIAFGIWVHATIKDYLESR